MKAACVVCRKADRSVVILSTGLPIHPQCWPKLRKTHTDAFFVCRGKDEQLTPST
jgi:hypothetical protein